MPCSISRSADRHGSTTRISSAAMDAMPSRRSMPRHATKYPTDSSIKNETSLGNISAK